jgi:hypothetical protein
MERRGPRISHLFILSVVDNTASDSKSHIPGETAEFVVLETGRQLPLIVPGSLEGAASTCIRLLSIWHLIRLHGHRFRKIGWRPLGRELLMA